MPQSGKHNLLHLNNGTKTCALKSGLTRLRYGKNMKTIYSRRMLVHYVMIDFIALNSTTMVAVTHYPL